MSQINSIQKQIVEPPVFSLLGFLVHNFRLMMTGALACRTTITILRIVPTKKQQ